MNKPLIFQLISLTTSLMLSSSIFAQSWTSTEKEMSSPGTYNTRFQFAEHTWGGSHGILLNAYKSISTNGSLGTTGNTKFASDAGSHSTGAGAIIFYANGGSMGFYVSQGSTGKDQSISWGTPKLWIKRDGRVGINTTSIPFGYQLAVNGKAIMEEVQVEVSSAWPDYVFTTDYQLPSLTAVKAHIEAEGHLPEVPSAEEVAEEGIALGEMNALLLKKIEELTLHIIRQQEEIDLLKENQNQLINSRKH